MPGNYNVWDKLEREILLHRILSIVSTALLLLGVYIFYKRIESQPFIVVPPVIEREFSVWRNGVSASYLQQVGEYIADRILTVGPENADRSFKEILPFLTTDPAQLKEIRGRLLADAQTIKENDIYGMFLPIRFIPPTKETTFSVEGLFKRLSSNVLIEEGVAKINFSYKMDKGRFQITKIEVAK